MKEKIYLIAVFHIFIQLPFDMPFPKKNQTNYVKSKVKIQIDLQESCFETDIKPKKKLLSNIGF